MKDPKPLAKGEVRQNSDVMADAIGAHPVGTSVGAVGGIAAGAALGTAAGPVGSLVGAAVGAVAGALAGSGVADLVDPAAEESYWRDEYIRRPYAGQSARYEDYAPAYRYGVDAYARYNGRDWHDVEAQLGSDWESARGGSSLAWADAQHAARDAWARLAQRTERALPGDADGDGR